MFSILFEHKTLYDMNSYIIVFVYETKLAMVPCKLYEKLLNDREKEGGGRERERVVGVY